MSDPHANTDRASLSVLIDAVADRFEAAWQGTTMPAIAEFLADWQGPARLRLLNELVLIDRSYRQRRGLPEPDYVRTWPELAERVSHATNSRAPERVGRYQIRAVLGSGSFGTVYRAFDEQMQREVAMKLLRDDVALPGAGAAAFLSEARVVAQLRHPHAVTVHDAGEADGCKYIVYELVEGESLRDRLARAALTAGEAVRLLAPIAEALHQAHTRGLLHRDVKPANILVDRGDRALLIDFGLGIREADLAHEAGRLVGSYAYLPPEMVRGEGHRLDGRGDVYSFGVMLYEAVCGRRPFRATERNALFEEILHQEPKPPRQINDTVPIALERVILKAMAKRITERYTTALDLANDLRAIDVDVRLSVPEQRAVTVEPNRAVAVVASAAHRSSILRPAVAIVPRGLRAFGGADADFFLDLLPGPRERDGLPESVQFWKTRVGGEAEPFRVGLLCGPSGCGKSSLVRAGLLPQLAEDVVTVYVEAERAGTETRLLERLRRACPEVGTHDLAGAVAALRRGALPGRKALIVIDQLEQWLQSGGGELADQPLVAALRQADGEHLQFLLLVRDDYWLSVSRLFHELELPLREGENLRIVDLFDTRHARRVLRALGEAHGALPGGGTPLTSAATAFLDEAVRQLSEAGKVVPVRLSLFAELMKSREWTPRTIREVGGIDGLGVTFLDETFCSRAAHPEHRRQAAAARAVLAALLPEADDVIRAQGRSHDELLVASGLCSDPDAFARLLDTLDRDLRLITPVEAESGGTACFQLAHDYLVPAVRQWLRQHEQASWRGRTRLRLAERAAQWSRQPRPRLLPSFPEYVAMMAAVPRGRRQPAEQQMLRAASGRLAWQATVLMIVGALLGWGAWETHGRVRARGLVETIEAATLEQANRIVTEELPAYERWAGAALRARASDATASRDRRLRASLAYPEQQLDFLVQCVLDGSANDVAVIRGRLQPFAPTVSPSLHAVLNDPERSADVRFRAALALPALESAGEWCAPHADFLARSLVQSSPDEQKELRELLRPIGKRLIDPLREMSRNGEYEQAVARALADFAGDDPELLATLAAEATPGQFAVILPVLAARSQHRARVFAVLQELAHDSHLGVEAGRRRAGAILTLFRLGDREAALTLLNQRADGDTRTSFLHRVRASGVEPAELARCLDDPSGTSLRYDLLLALGEYAKDEVPATLRSRLTPRIIEWQQSDARAGVHAACGWLLGRWDSPGAAAVPSFPPPADRGWFVRRIGSDSLTFAILPRGRAVIGSPEEERFHVRDEVVRDVVIESPVAIADREVTVGQWNAFLQARGKTPIAEDVKLPARDLSWYEAVAFCRWLTAEAGMSEADQAYRLPEKPEYTSDGLVKNWEFDPRRPGFRLPTDAEWEAACRAGSREAYSFGNDAAWLDRYGWFLGSSERKPHRVATARPNRLGLFDMHGNVWEWCQDEYEAPGGGERTGTRVYRGGSFDNYPRHGRCACRINDQPAFRFPFVGLRVVFSLPQAP